MVDLENFKESNETLAKVCSMLIKNELFSNLLVIGTYSDLEAAKKSSVEADITNVFKALDKAHLSGPLGGKLIKIDLNSEIVDVDAIQL